MMSRRFFLFIVVVILTAVAGWTIANKWHYSHVREDVRLSVRNRAMPYAQAFDSAIEERFALLEGLHGFAKTLPEEKIQNYFDSYAQELYSIKQGVRNISI